MANPFDQFDEPAAQANPFDQFDASPQQAAPQGPSPASSSGLTLKQVGRDIGRGAGLATRSVIEGAGAPFIAITDAAGRLLLGDKYYPVSKTLTYMGLPEPATRSERMVSALGEGATAAATGVGLGRVLSNAAGSTTRAIGSLLAENPTAQLVGGASSGGSSQAVTEAGGGPWASLVAGLGGGLLGSWAALPKSRVQVPMRVEPTLGDMGDPAANLLATQTATSAQANAAAQDAAKAIGLNWAAIDDGMRARIQQSVARALQTSDIPPEAAARAALYESLGLTPTRGLATRSLGDTRSEQVLLQQPEGGLLRGIYDQNNSAIREKIQALRPEGVDPVDAPTFGERFRAPIASGERKHQRVANQFYRDAEAAEGGNLTSVQPLVDHIQQNLPMLEATDAAKPVIAYLRQQGVISPKSMEVIATPQATHPVGLGYQAADMNLRELAGLRRVVNQAWSGATNRGDDLAAAQLNQIRGFINDAEGAAGGKLYNAYRRLRSNKAGLYEDNPLIDRLISDRKGYRGTNLIEDSEVFDKAVLGSNIEQFSKVWPRLRGDARDLTRAQMAKYIEDKAFSNMATNERGDVVASAAKLNQVLTSIGPEKLRLIYGKAAADQLQTLNTALREISNPPRGSIPSGSAPMVDHLVRSTFRVLRSLPFIGDTAAQQAQEALVSRQNAAAVNNAINFLPTSQVVSVPARLPRPLTGGGFALGLLAPYEQPDQESPQGLLDPRAFSR